MIILINGEGKIAGALPDIMVQYFTITKSIMEMLTDGGVPEEKARELIQTAYDMAFMNDEEVANEAKIAKLALNLRKGE